MTVIKILDLKDDCQGWRVKTMMMKLLMLPGAWMNWWQR